MNIRTTVDGKMLVEDAQIMRGIFRNFSGEKEGRYDQKGRRYFNMLIDDPSIAQKMMADNLPVKILAPREPEDEPQHIMKISMKPENRYFPCKVRTVCNGVLTTLDPDDHGWDILDTAEIVGDIEDRLATLVRAGIHKWIEDAFHYLAAPSRCQAVFQFLAIEQSVGYHPHLADITPLVGDESDLVGHRSVHGVVFRVGIGIHPMLTVDGHRQRIVG